MDAKVKETFYQIRRDLDASKLAGFVQNDLKCMLEDGQVTKEDIANTLPEIKREFEAFRNRATECENAVLAIYSEILQ
jgi:hypothetical protein